MINTIETLKLLSVFLPIDFLVNNNFVAFSKISDLQNYITLLATFISEIITFLKTF